MLQVVDPNAAVPLAQHIVTGVIGFGSGLAGAIIGALALMWNGDRQRSHEQALQTRQLEEARKGIRRELDGLLVDLATDAALIRATGWMAPNPLDTHLKRLRELVQSKGALATFESPALARGIYYLIPVIDSTSDQLNIADAEAIGQDALTPDDPEYERWLDGICLEKSATIEPMCRSLRDIFEALADNTPIPILNWGDDQYEARVTAYAEGRPAHSVFRPPAHISLTIHQKA